MKQNYYTAEEAMAVLEPRIREMFKDHKEAKEQETRNKYITRKGERKKDMANKDWGFLREINAEAQAAGIDQDTGVIRTGLEEYLAVIFPEIEAKEWIHNKGFGSHNGKKYTIRPDYRCEQLNLIIEFDGIGHYKDPIKLQCDKQKDEIYTSCGYTVVRIPYFIQLTNQAVKILFGKDVKEQLFDGSIPSMGIKEKNTPAFCCPIGIERMAEELVKFPEQLKTNLAALQDMNNEELTGVKYLEAAIEKVKNK